MFQHCDEVDDDDSEQDDDGQSTTTTIQTLTETQQRHWMLQTLPEPEVPQELTFPHCNEADDDDSKQDEDGQSTTTTIQTLTETQQHHWTLQTLLELLRALTLPRRDEVDDDEEGVGGGVGEVGGRLRRGKGCGAALPLDPACCCNCCGPCCCNCFCNSDSESV